MYQQYPQINPMDAIRRNRLSVKSFLSTSNVLTIAILNIITIVLNFISSLFSSSFANELLAEAFKSLDMDMDFNSGISISIPVIPILTVIAFFLLYGAGKNKNPDTPNSAGATMLFVISIIQLVCYCLIFVLCILAVILVVVFASAVSSSSAFSSYYKFGFINSYVDSSTSSMLGVFGILLLVIGLAALVFTFIYAISMVNFSSSIKKGLTTTELTSKGAKTVGVCYVFFSIFSGISMLSTLITSGCSLATSSMFSRSDVIISLILSVISSVITFVLNINMAKFAFSFNRHIQTESIMNSTYQAPQQPYPYDYNQYQQPVNYQQPSYDAYNQPAESDGYYQENQYNQPAASQYTCPVCGTEIVPNQAFCAECGYKLN